MEEAKTYTLFFMDMSLLFTIQQTDIEHHIIAPLTNVSNGNISFGMETNGTKLSEEWVSLIKKYNISVGISIDGPQEVHDANRYFADGRSTYSPVIKNAEHLKKEGVPIGAISVLSPILTQYSPKKFYKWFLKSPFDTLLLRPLIATRSFLEENYGVTVEEHKKIQLLFSWNSLTFGHTTKIAINTYLHLNIMSEV